jgi:putative membrane protein
MMMYGGGWLLWLVVLILGLLLVGGLFAWGLWLVTRNAKTGGHQPTSRGDGALEILRQRYAKGEITDEEYESMRERLSR